MAETTGEPARPKVLVTGASGLIGRLTRERLGDRYDFSAVNRRPVAGVPCLQADIARSASALSNSRAHPSRL